jgi:predicted nucleic acid-binding protein
MACRKAVGWEYEAVLLRPVHLKAARVSAADVNNLLDVLASVIVPVEVFYLWRPQLKDANDEMVLEAAVSGQTDAIVTFNARDFALGGKIPYQGDEAE